MIPGGWALGEFNLKSYKDFQNFPNEVREFVLLWLDQQLPSVEKAFQNLRLMESAANDSLMDDALKLLVFNEFIEMLYCWVENDRDDLRAKLAYVEGRRYAPD